MKDNSWFTNVLIVVIFSATAMVGMILINDSVAPITVSVNEQFESASNRIYLVEEETTSQTSRISIYAEPVTEGIKTGNIQLEFDKERVSLNEIYIGQDLIGQNQQVDSASGIAVIEFKVTDDSIKTDSFKVAELFFVRNEETPFQVKLSESSNLNSTDNKVTINSLELI